MKHRVSKPYASQKHAVVAQPTRDRNSPGASGSTNADARPAPAEPERYHCDDRKPPSDRAKLAEPFLCHDIDDAMTRLAACDVLVRIKPLTTRSGRIEIRSVRSAGNGMAVARTLFEEPVEIAPIEVLDAYHILLPLAGSTAIDLDNCSIDCRHPNALIFDALRLKTLRRSAGSENFGILIDQRRLTNRLFELTGVPVTRRLSFSPDLDFGSAASGALRALVACAGEPDFLKTLDRAPLSVNRLSALVVDLMLEVLPHNYQDAMRPGSNVIAPRHVKRAVAYIDARLDGSLVTEELAEVSGVSLRALQYGFRKFLGMSISEYERSARLAQVRREIESKPQERVGVIAKRWGFSNLTRFNAQFEAAFGISAMALRSQRGHRE